VARRFVIGFLLGVLVVIGGLIGFRQALAGRILPGVLVGGVDVGSMSPVAARAALADRFGTLERGTVAIKTGRGTAAIPFERLGRKVELDAMVDRAVAVGRGGSAFDEALAGLRLLVQPVTVAPVVTFDRARLTTELTTFSDSLRIEPVDAAVAPWAHRRQRNRGGPRRPRPVACAQRNIGACPTKNEAGPAGSTI